MVTKGTLRACTAVMVLIITLQLKASTASAMDKGVKCTPLCNEVCYYGLLAATIVLTIMVGALVVTLIAVSVALHRARRAKNGRRGQETTKNQRILLPAIPISTADRPQSRVLSAHYDEIRDTVPPSGRGSVHSVSTSTSEHGEGRGYSPCRGIGPAGEDSSSDTIAAQICTAQGPMYNVVKRDGRNTVTTEGSPADGESGYRKLADCSSEGQDKSDIQLNTKAEGVYYNCRN